jgi:hypothetical protein
MLDDALVYAQRYNPAAEVSERMQTLLGALEDLKVTEQAAVEVSGLLSELRALGATGKQDFVAWDTIRANLLDTELAFFAPLRSMLLMVDGRLDTGYARDLPAPRIMPAVSRPSRLYALQLPEGYQMPVRLSRPGQVQVVPKSTEEAQSAPEAAGAAGLGLAPIIWAAIAIGVVGVVAAAIAAVFVLQHALEAIAHVAVVKAQVEQYRTMLEARLNAYQSCMAERRARGETDDADQECLELAGFLIPSPREAGLQPEPPEFVDTGWYVVGGAVAVVVASLAFLGFRTYAAAKGVSGLDRSTSRRRKRQKPRGRPAPKRVFDLEGASTYDLEIDD